MEWQESPPTAEMVNAAPAGTTLCVSSVTYGYELKADVEWSSNQLRLTVVSGAYGYVSDWLDMSPQSEQQVTVQLILEALERWLLHATSRASRPERRLTAIEAVTSLYTNLESILA